MGPLNTTSLPKFPGVSIHGDHSFGPNAAAVVSKANDYLQRRCPRLDTKKQNILKGPTAPLKVFTFTFQTMHEVRLK